MKKAIEVDLVDLSDILESLVSKMYQKKFTNAELVDIAARLKGVEKNCKAIDDAVKAIIKTELKETAGTFLGLMFKAKLNYFPVERLDQATLKEERPVIFAQYIKTNNESRITFEPR